MAGVIGGDEAVMSQHNLETAYCVRVPTRVVAAVKEMLLAKGADVVTQHRRHSAQDEREHVTKRVLDGAHEGIEQSGHGDSPVVAVAMTQDDVVSRLEEAFLNVNYNVLCVLVTIRAALSRHFRVGRRAAGP